MKHLLIAVMAIGLFTACKDNNSKPRDDREYQDRDRDRDRGNNDYDDRDMDRNNNDRNNDDRNVDYNDDRRNNDDSYNDDRRDNSGGGWSQANVNEFVSNCVTSAAQGGMQRNTAQSYCDCMQRHIEKMYPNAEDAGQLSNADLETPAMKRKIQECLGQ